MAKVLLIRCAPAKTVNNRQGRNVRRMSKELENKLNAINVPMVIRDVSTNPPTLDPDDIQRMAQEVLAADVIALECPVYAFGVPFPLRVWLSALKKSGRMHLQTAFRQYSALTKKTVIFLESVSELFECMMKEIAAEHMGDLKNRWKELGVERFEPVKMEIERGMTQEEEELRWGQCVQELSDVVRKLQQRWNTGI